MMGPEPEPEPAVVHKPASVAMLKATAIAGSAGGGVSAKGGASGTIINFLHRSGEENTLLAPLADVLQQASQSEVGAAERVDTLALLGLHEESESNEVARAITKLSHRARRDPSRYAEILAAAVVLQCEHAMAKRPKLAVARETWAELESPVERRHSTVVVGEPGATPKTIWEFHGGVLPEPLSLSDPAEREPEFTELASTPAAPAGLGAISLLSACLPWEYSQTSGFSDLHLALLRLILAKAWLDERLDVPDPGIVEAVCAHLPKVIDYHWRGFD